MLTLKQACQFCDVSDDECICFVTRGEEYKYAPPCYWTVREIRRRLDMKRTMVLHVRPRFCFGEYEGWTFVVDKIPRST